MDKDFINNLLNQSVSWLTKDSSVSTIVLSSRIRLSRNVQGINFPINAEENDKEWVYSLTESAIEKNKNLENFHKIDVNEISELNRKFLLERHLISREFCTGTPYSLLLINSSETVSLMVNEEDHLRLQVITPGGALNDVWNKADKIDDELSKEMPFSFDNKLGFLTSSPTSVGTAMRASIMLNLPALAISGYINGLIHGLGKLGFSVKGLYGEGSVSVGNFYQISNLTTLGDSEIKILEKLQSMVSQIVMHEKNARIKLLEEKKNYLLDQIGRAFGTLSYSYILSSKEALNSLSLLRLGVELGMFSSIDMEKVNKLFMAVQPAHLQKTMDKTLNREEANEQRANIVRNQLQT